MKRIFVVGTLLTLALGGCLSSSTRDNFDRMIAEIDRDIGMRAPAPAPRAIDGPLTVDEAAAIAVESNPQLLARIHAVKAESEKVAIESSLDDPRLSVEINKVPTAKPLDVGGRENEMYGATQEFPLFGKLDARARRELHASRAELEMFRDTVNEIRMKTKSAYYEYTEHYFKHKIHEEHRGLWDNVLKVVGAKYRTGQAPYSDLVMAQTTVAEIEQEVNTHHQRFLTSWARLNTLMNRGADEQPVEPKFPEPAGTEEAYEELLARAAEHNPELKASAESIRKEESGLDLAKKDQRYPDIMAGWTYERDAGGPDGWNGMLSINLPWIFDRRRAEVRMGESKLRASRAEYAAKGREIEYQLKAAFERARAARKNALIYRENIIPVTEQNIAVAEKFYRTGAIDFGTYSSYLSNLIMAKEKYYELIAEHGMATAEIEKLTGGAK